MDLCRAKPAVTQGLGFCGFIQMAAPFSRLTEEVFLPRSIRYQHKDKHDGYDK